MTIALVVFIIALFLGLLFLNLYFRIKVLKSYKILVQNRVDFEAKWILDKKKMESEVIPKHPAMANEIRTFANHIRYSVKIASILIVLITIFGCILMYYR